MSRAPTPRLARAVASLGALFVSACGMGFDPASFVERPRLVGAEVVVDGAAGRATPLPGDAVSLVPWVLQPAESSPVRASVLVCAANDVRRGAAGCAGAPLALVPAGPAADTIPPVPFVVPTAETLGATGQLLVVFASCDRGALPSLDPATLLPSCDDPAARAELSSLNLPLAFSPELANRHPSLADETFTIDTRAWEPPPETTPPLGCARDAETTALPLVRVPADAAPPDADEPYAITLSFTTSDDDRESYGPASSPLRESLQLSHYVTRGRMARSFSAVDATSEVSQPITIDWNPPAVGEIAAEGELVRFTWIARDLRGGFARADRAICLSRD
ncbi:MAG: hypothetical protein K1X94_33835 [Sandaracinaceae bacterium]|nr:hypothetical protein [Sandaracinaceae bacterium]